MRTVSVAITSFGLWEFVKMLQIQLMCVVLYLTVDVAISQSTEFLDGECPQSITLVNEMMQEIQALRASMSDMQSRQKEMQTRQREMETMQESNLAMLHSIFELLRNASANSTFELLRNASTKQLSQPCPPLFQQNDSLKSCYHFSQSELSWRQARQQCLDMQAYLVEVESKEEDDFIRASIAARGGSSHWLGGSDTLREGIFKWSHSGQAFTYTNWQSGQPNNVRNQDCVEAYPDRKWNDIPCARTRLFICESNY